MTVRQLPGIQRTPEEVAEDELAALVDEAERLQLAKGPDVDVLRLENDAAVGRLRALYPKAFDDVAYTRRHRSTLSRTWWRDVGRRSLTPADRRQRRLS